MPARFDASLSRRAFLGRVAGLTALGAGGPLLLAACGGGTGGGTPEAPVVEAATCRGYSAESEPVRASLGYVDESVIAGQHCANCKFYVAPVSAGERCGGCTVIPGTGGNGPVSPGGYCRSWAAKA